MTTGATGTTGRAGRTGTTGTTGTTVRLVRLGTTRYVWVRRGPASIVFWNGPRTTCCVGAADSGSGREAGCIGVSYGSTSPLVAAQCSMPLQFPCSRSFVRPFSQRPPGGFRVFYPVVSLPTYINPNMRIFGSRTHCHVYIYSQYMFPRDHIHMCPAAPRSHTHLHTSSRADPRAQCIYIFVVRNEPLRSWVRCRAGRVT
jgi:hypothetical protein